MAILVTAVDVVVGGVVVVMLVVFILDACENASIR